MMDRPQRYSSTQIWLHWCVAAGIILQVASHEPIVRVMEAVRNAREAVSSDMTLAYFHVAVGTSILLAVLARIWLRVRHGTPAPVPGTSRLAALAADFVHRAFYVLLLAMVATGILTWRDVADLGLIHFGINAAIVALALGHAGIAIAHQIVLKDGVLARMVPLLSWPERVE